MLARRAGGDEAYVALMQRQERAKIEVPMPPDKAFEHSHARQIYAVVRICSCKTYMFTRAHSRPYVPSRAQAKRLGGAAAGQKLAPQLSQQEQERQQNEAPQTLIFTRMRPCTYDKQHHHTM